METKKEVLTEEELLEEIKKYRESPMYQMTCPCCNHKSKIYRRQFDSTFVMFLMSLVHLRKTDFKASKTVPYFKVQEYAVKTFNRRITDYNLIEKWDLIVNIDGNICLSSLGFQFLKGTLNIPKILYIRNDQIISQSDETVNVMDFLTSEDFQHKNNGGNFIKN